MFGLVIQELKEKKKKFRLAALTVVAARNDSGNLLQSQIN